MQTTVAAEPVPLTADAEGVLRIAGTRVQLETVVAAFEAGATAEEIAQDYPSLKLSDLYAVLTYCLRHPEEVEAYMATRRAWAEEMREKVRARFDPAGLRERLRARLRG